MWSRIFSCTYETVLLPTDGSEVAAGAVEHAIDAATRHDATVHVLYVVDENVANAAPGLAMGEISEQLEDEGERAVAELTEEISAAGLDTETAIRVGAPDEEILRDVDEVDADPVTMGSTGKRIVERERVGSVTDALVRKANVPVLAVPRAEDDASGLRTALLLCARHLQRPEEAEVGHDTGEHEHVVSPLRAVDEVEEHFDDRHPHEREHEVGHHPGAVLADVVADPVDDAHRRSPRVGRVSCGLMLVNWDGSAIPLPPLRFPPRRGRPRRGRAVESGAGPFR